MLTSVFFVFLIFRKLFQSVKMSPETGDLPEQKPQEVNLLMLKTETDFFYPERTASVAQDSDSVSKSVILVV